MTSKYYTVYKTTNIINGKVYIGVHATKTPNDSYLGSGKYLRNAIKKYGKDNFLKEVIATFANERDMLDFESWLVNEDFIKTANTYNLKTGGIGSFSYINSSFGIQQKRIQSIRNSKHLYTPFRDEKNRHKPSSEQLRELSKASQSPTARAKRKATLKATKHQVGCKNSQFGTKWVSNLESNVTIKIKSSQVREYLSKGWILGRIHLRKAS